MVVRKAVRAQPTRPDPGITEKRPRQGLRYRLQLRRIKRIAAPTHVKTWGNTCIFCDQPIHWGTCDEVTP